MNTLAKVQAMQGQQVEKLILKIQEMDRGGLVQTLRGLKCDFTIDFTEEFLDSVSLERLKHIVLAASLHAHDGAAAI